MKPLVPSYGVTARQVLGNPRVWILPTVLVGVVSFLLSMLYMGGILNPRTDLDRLPVALVNLDRGGAVNGHQENLGAQITAGIAATAATDHRTDWQVLSAEEARDRMASDKVYGTIEVPENFTTAIAGLATTGQQSPPRPVMRVLTNPGAGSLASSFASTAAQQASHQASQQLGQKLTEAVHAAGVPTSSAAALMLADPVTVTVDVGHPIGSHSGLGLSAFYYALLLVMSGFLGANIIGNGVDAALGYADNEVGPWHTRRRAVPITRTRTFVVKSTMSLALAALTSGLIMVATIGLLGMDADHLPLLFLFSFCASAAVGLGVQAINAAFGGLGQLISMFVFIVLALPSSGATIPLQALPTFYRFLAHFEPMRQLSDGVRAILYFDARADAGLTRAWTMIGIGTVLALILGFGMTAYYDRKGLRRLVPEWQQPGADAAGESSREGKSERNEEGGEAAVSG
ncbi:DUF3533 domain-containing protein [Kitasatospora sp. NPDC048540]|uniref:YhgE/Pip domain-containing protein n=1 Tax=unclassified Kitasatospora TaxID=2633591 RepID=UPI0007C6EB1A|nr:DUF3533 domain-containing protein [Kitasatospora sp. MBT63]